MIRRHTDPAHFYLITQPDHAQLSGQLARHLGNDRFAAIDDTTITAISMHDAGWPLHDDTPTLNPEGLPRDVFESNRQIALPVWTASADRAEAVHPYAGLLVSLHGLALSVFATSHAPSDRESFDLANLQSKFAVNQFQHHEVERQERLREHVGLRTDLPLTFGLANVGVDPAEDLLRHHFRLLQAMDMLSLAICCTAPPAPTTQDVHPQPGRAPVRLVLSRPQPDLLLVDPWPFDQPRLTFNVPARRVAAHAYGSEAAFQTVYRDAPRDMLSLIVAARL